MKRKYRAVLGLILAGGVCLSGCSKPGGEASAAQKLGGSFTTEMTMQMEDWTACRHPVPAGRRCVERCLCRAIHARRGGAGLFRRGSDSIV